MRFKSGVQLLDQVIKTLAELRKKGWTYEYLPQTHAITKKATLYCSKQEPYLLTVKPTKLRGPHERTKNHTPIIK